MPLHLPGQSDGRPIPGGIVSPITPTPRSRRGRHVVDRFGRRLLDADGKFLVDDENADPCCQGYQGCPWGVSLQCPDVPGVTYAHTTAIADILPYWKQPTRISLPRMTYVDILYADIEGVGGPTGSLFITGRNAATPLGYAIKAFDFSCWTCGNCPGIEPPLSIPALQDPSPYSARLIVVQTTFGSDVLDYISAEIELHTYARRGCENWLSCAGANATIAKCRWASELAEGVQPEALGAVHHVGSGPAGYESCYGDCGHNVIYGPPETSITGGVPIYKFIQTGAAPTVRIHAHGTAGRAYGSLAWYVTVTAPYLSFGAPFLYPYILSNTSGPVQTRCTEVEWANAIDIPLSGMPRIGDYAMLNLVPSGGMSSSGWCVIDEIEIL